MDDKLICAIMDALSMEVWRRAECSSHRPENVARWIELWLDANSRHALAEAIAEKLRLDGYCE